VKCLDRNLELDGSNADAWNCRGEALNCVGEFAEAIRMFEKAIELAPGQSVFYKNKRYALNSLGRGGEALGCYYLAGV